MEVISRNLVSNDWITLVFIIALVLIALMKLYKPQLLLGYTIALFSQGFIENRAEKKPSIFATFHVLIFAFSTIIFSITLYFVLEDFLLIKAFNFVNVFIGLTTFLIVKFLFIKLIAKTLDIEEETRYFIFSQSGYMYNISIWLFPVLILFNYWYSNIRFLLFFICLLLIFRGFLIIRNNKKLIFNNFFYFILYFCSLELAPLLIIYKTTTT
ncbi:DUF4271 domain-containing protein [Tenacibaculum sp. MEBiC06402]|uniref:DUF4271 domain-containing protein n=1 Tax=unclassified Tenacibaculum TaxID=2635139 RepID=UPI003B9A2328